MSIKPGLLNRLFKYLFFPHFYQPDLPLTKTGMLKSSLLIGDLYISSCDFCQICFMYVEAI